MASQELITILSGSTKLLCTRCSSDNVLIFRVENINLCKMFSGHQSQVNKFQFYLNWIIEKKKCKLNNRNQP